MTVEGTLAVAECEPKDIQRELESSYLAYAMSVIVGRALPDVRDGLKPVQRRILYAMYEAGNTADKGYRKSAKTVGDVLGRYHPHGDAAVYDTMVRMAQDFVMRYPLVDGQGNFGSIDGDPAAAMRYTEARLSKLAEAMLTDIEKDTVDFGDNFDASEKEPLVLPSRFPNLLANGCTGIAVGMATNIPPHNLNELIDGCLMLLDNPNATVEELGTVIKGPDFPTGARILGTDGIREYQRTGKGTVTIRAKTMIEPMSGGRHRIVISELPYNVNKARLIETIAQLHRDKRIDGITDLRDESGRDGIRIVVDVRRDVNPNVLLNQLYKHSQLQQNFSVNMLALVDGRPRTLNLKEMLHYYLKHQLEVIVRRSQFEKKRADGRAHILQGLLMALDNIDAVIEIIRLAPSINDAKERLQGQFGLTEAQAQHILDMQLRRLTGLEREKLLAEYQGLTKQTEYLAQLIASDAMQRAVLKEELIQIRNRFGDARRTKIEHAEGEIDREQVEADEDVVVTLSYAMYIKSTPLSQYRSQRRGGKGVQGAQIKKDDDADFIEHLVTTSRHQWLLFFTNTGRVYKVRCWDIPMATRNSKGTPIINVLAGLRPDERIQAVVSVRNLEDPNAFLFFATASGFVKKTPLSEYANIRQTGIAAIQLAEGDSVLNVKLTDGNRDILLVSSAGKAIRFSESEVRPTGRATQGMRGIALDVEHGDQAVGMDVVDPDAYLLVVTSNGIGKRTPIGEHRKQGRGGQGMRAINLVPEKHGKLVGVQIVHENDELIVVSEKGVMLRTPVKSIRATGRVTQGFVIINLDENDRISTVARVAGDD